MSSYNLINGQHTSESYELLTGILRDEWGYDGLVTTDWWNLGEHYKEALAGNDVKMPTSSNPEGYYEKIKDKITRNELAICAKRVLEMILWIE